MTDIVDLKDYRTRQLEKRAFGPWDKRFGCRHTRETRLQDLSDNLLFLLARPGEAGAVLYYELIMGALDLGNPMKFYFLEDDAKITVIDIHLFLADQIRLEMLHRLGWLEPFAAGKYPLLDMVLSFRQYRDICRRSLPVLAASHPRFKEYSRLKNADKDVFIRKLLPEALECFQKQLL